MTLTVKCQQAFTDTTKPIVRYDKILTNGSLLLIDPAHPALPWASGIPGDNTLVPNVAINEAKATIAGATDTDVQPTWFLPSTFTGAVGKIERTGKGALHGIPSQVNDVTNSGPLISLPLRIIRYLLNNPRHNYYMSSWSRYTRGPLSGGEGPVFVISSEIGSDLKFIIFGRGGADSNLTPTQWGYKPDSTPALTSAYLPSSIQTAVPDRFSVGTADWWNQRGTYPSPMPGDGSNDSLNGGSAGGIIGFGPVPRKLSVKPDGTVVNGAYITPQSASAALHKSPSKIFYRFYLEDLTVSGRSYATVDAIDAAMFLAAFTAGTGRYGSDTFTDPATLP